jgi:hypothetical protein
MLLSIPRSLCALKRVAAKTEHHKCGATSCEKGHFAASIR